MSNRAHVGETVLGALLFFPVVFPLVAAVSHEASQNQHGAPDEQILERRVKPHDSEYQTAGGILGSCLFTAGLAGGVVEVTGCEGTPPVATGRLPEMTLREALELITEIDPDYRWEMNDGVINLLPVAGEPEFLKVDIKNLRINSVGSLSAAIDVLLELPEVEQAKARLQLTPGLQRVGGLRSLTPQVTRYTIKCAGVTLREALNAIVLAHGQAGWLTESAIVTESARTQSTSSIAMKPPLRHRAAGPERCRLDGSTGYRGEF